MSEITTPLPVQTGLIYVADPMCSWCYGFAPSLTALRERWPELPMAFVMGGLRAAGAELTPALQSQIAHYWQEVGARSGQPFDPAGLARKGWTYTTEPACRAVVAVRTLDAERVPAVFEAIQTAFYRDARDTTDPGVLRTIAVETGLDGDAFDQAFANAVAATQADFEQVQAWGIQGFPTLLAHQGEQLSVIARGWLEPAQLVERAASVLAR